MKTIVVDPKGNPATVYHGTAAPIESFDPLRTADGGFHFGTHEQALMRAGSEGILIPAKLEIIKARRLKDDGQGWKKRIKEAKSAGYDGIVYLNRFEGINRETVMRAYRDKIDLNILSDRDFLKFAPEMHDSYIAFYPEQIRLIR